MDSDDAPSIDGATLRRVLGHYPTGVSVVTACEASGEKIGMVVGTFTSVSLDPPLVGFLPDRGSTTWPRIQAAGRFCVNVLGTQQLELSRVFSAKGVDRFAAVAHRLSANGSPVIDGALLYVDCDLHAVHEAGDHWFVLGRVRELGAAGGEPLLFFRGGYGSFLGHATPD